MIFRARQLGMPVINASPAVLLVHQNHAYGHVPAATGDRCEGSQAERNLQLVDGPERFFTPEGATHVLTDGGVARRPWEWSCRRRSLTAVGALHRKLRPLWGVLGESVDALGWLSGAVDRGK